MSSSISKLWCYGMYSCYGATLDFSGYRIYGYGYLSNYNSDIRISDSLAYPLYVYSQGWYAFGASSFKNTHKIYGRVS